MIDILLLKASLGELEYNDPEFNRKTKQEQEEKNEEFVNLEGEFIQLPQLKSDVIVDKHGQVNDSETLDPRRANRVIQ
jgi:hypothetical protein